MNEVRAARTYFFDASAIVKVIAREAGGEKARALFQSCGRAHTSWVLLAECLGAFKRKRSRGELSDHAYGLAVFELFGHIRSGKLHPVDVAIREGEAVLITHETEAINNRKRYPSLDVADTLQMTAIRESFLQIFAGESQTRLVTCDAELAKAAESENILVERV